MSNNYIPLVPSTLVTDSLSSPPPRSVGCSLLSGVLWAPLQPDVSAVRAQHRPMPSCHRPLWVPLWLHGLPVQPRQVASWVLLIFLQLSLKFFCCWCCFYCLFVFLFIRNWCIRLHSEVLLSREVFWVKSVNLKMLLFLHQISVSTIHVKISRAEFFRQRMHEYTAESLSDSGAAYKICSLMHKDESCAHHVLL